MFLAYLTSSSEVQTHLVVPCRPQQAGQRGGGGGLPPSSLRPWDPEASPHRGWTQTSWGPPQRSGDYVNPVSLNCDIFFSFIFISWRPITYNIVVVFVIHWHESAMELHVFPIPIPSPTSLSTQFLWVFPEHQAHALVSCIQPGLVISFTLDNIHVSMLFSRNIPPSPSPTESKSLFCTSVSLFLFRI